MSKRETVKRKGLEREIHAYEAALKEVKSSTVRIWLESQIESRKAQL